MAKSVKLSREEQRATAFYANGPYKAHNAITCAVVNGPDDFHQTVATILGGHRLAELLNHVDKVANQYTSEIIASNPHMDAKQIVAHAVAKSLGWRLELPEDRKDRLRDKPRDDGTWIEPGHEPGGKGDA